MGRDASPQTGNKGTGLRPPAGTLELSEMGIRVVGGQSWGQRLCSEGRSGGPVLGETQFSSAPGRAVRQNFLRRHSCFRPAGSVWSYVPRAAEELRFSCPFVSIQTVTAPRGWWP